VENYNKLSDHQHKQSSLTLVNSNKKTQLSLTKPRNAE